MFSLVSCSCWILRIAGPAGVLFATGLLLGTVLGTALNARGQSR
jgi:hypothetical protein